MTYKHLTVEEREKIQYGLWEKKSIRYIATELGRSPSSVCREINRNLPPQHYRYTPRLANSRALEKRTSRGKAKLVVNERLRAYVTSQLKAGWSPEQIAGTSNKATGYRISHEAIYQYIYAQIYRDGCGYVRPDKEDLRTYLKLRHKQRIRKGLRGCKKLPRLGGVSIEQRPQTVALRKNLGHWEGDSVVSRKSSVGLNTLVERKSGLVFITKVADATALATEQAVVKRFSILPKKLRKSLTLDNGGENACWRSLEQQLDITCYFAHAYHSWERGSNENTNGLIRWYFPKGTNFATIPEETVRAVELALNSRPRKRLGWRTPLEVFNQKLQSAALEG